MTEEEMKTVIEIISKADGGCSVCVKELWIQAHQKLKIPVKIFQKYKDLYHYYDDDFFEDFLEDLND